jgi:hypothetical protein
MPIGLLMGMPFPTGVRLAERLHPPLVPWGWCINACATVLGSVLSVLVAMFTSFTAVLCAAAGAYLVATLALLLSPDPKTTGNANQMALALAGQEEPRTAGVAERQ